MLLINKNGAPSGNFVHSRREATFETDTLPSWLTTSLFGGATATVKNDALGSHLHLETVGSGNNQINFADIDTTKAKMVRAQWHFLPDTKIGVNIAARFLNVGPVNTNMASWGRHHAGIGTTTFRQLQAGANTYLQTRIPPVITGAYYNLSFWLDLTDGMGYTGRGNTPWDEFDYSAILPQLQTSVRPSLLLNDVDSTRSSLKLYKASVDWWV